MVEVQPFGLAPSAIYYGPDRVAEVPAEGSKVMVDVEFRPDMTDSRTRKKGDGTESTFTLQLYSCDVRIAKDQQSTK